MTIMSKSMTMMAEEQGPLERRLVLRLLSYWRQIGSPESFPARAKIDPAAIRNLWPYCILLDCAGKEDDPEIAYIGEGFTNGLGAGLTGARISELPSFVLASHALSFFRETLEKRVPVIRGGQFLDLRGVHILFRSIILPLAEDGAAIDGLLCAANCREVTRD